MKAEAIRKVRSSRLFCSSFNKSILFTNVYIYIYICVCVCVCARACVCVYLCEVRQVQNCVN